MRNFIVASILFLELFVGLGEVYAAKFTLRDGRVIEGKMAQLSRVDERTGTPDVISRPIVVVDDGLRYVYLAKPQIRVVNEEQTAQPPTFKTGQRSNYDGKEYFIPGTYSNTVPFDKFGRRLLPIRHIKGIEHAEQAIVELTPYYVSVTSLRGNNEPLNWNMRIATNAIPREQITSIVMNTVDPKNFEERIKLVRFYHGGGLYDSADTELESVMLEWKEEPDVQQRLRSMSLYIRQDKYQQLLDEFEFRWKNGQYQLARKYIAELEQDPQLPERLLERVQRNLREYDENDQQCQEIVATFKKLYEQLPETEKNDKILNIIAEIEQELNYVTKERLNTFHLYGSNPQLSADEKLAIGITGWYAGAGADNSRLALALAFPETEQLIIDYLRSGQDYLLRQRIIEQLKNLETSRPDLIAGILATMKPPFSNLPPEDSNVPGYYRFTIPNPLAAAGVPGSPRTTEIRYTVQLPPEYNPHLRYPMVVSLNGSRPPDAQIDWWAGPWQDGMRKGHATRHGYIVLAPEWNPTGLSDYDFSVHSHAAVLGAVKDAFRRFSVNTDKVFISGHGIGGTAAWDIALAHPDLWAGAIPFNAVASKYIEKYQSAVRHVPLYLVWGEMEGEGLGTRRKWTVNAPTLNRYFLTQERPGDVTAVRYIGRGLESFYEEILHVLEWMKLRQRSVAPFEFAAETLRPWDSFFWWVEMPNLNVDSSRNMVDPIDFPAKGSVTPVNVQSKLYRATNTVSVTTRPRVAHVQIFLTPDIIDFRAKAAVKVNDKNYLPPNGMIEPNIEVMLEDVRTRCDRLHPYWALFEGR
jgi:pimeloyl-ACP methyl ester carboxylesterase